MASTYANPAAGEAARGAREADRSGRLIGAENTQVAPDVQAAWIAARFGVPLPTAGAIASAAFGEVCR